MYGSMMMLFTPCNSLTAPSLSAMQLEAFDLVNCLIAPIFFANTLSMWTRSVLSGIYCAVLLIKGYQMALLLLPNARRVQAHKHARCASAYQSRHQLCLCLTFDCCCWSLSGGVQTAWQIEHRKAGNAQDVCQGDKDACTAGAHAGSSR